MPAKQFDLSAIRDALARQEETIVFSVIERGQYTLNAQVYTRGELSLTPGDAQFPHDSFFEHFLYQTEQLHSRLGRYRAQDLEHAFFAARSLPTPALSKTPTEPWGQPLAPNSININDEILSVYVEQVAPRISLKAGEGDDGHCGSTCVCDIALIQALSHRVHYGKLVAETKFRAETERFQALIKAQDAAGIMQALTNEAVEKQVIERVRIKAARYGRSEDEGGGAFKVDPQIIADVFRDIIIPLNKKVQVQYLLQRC
jgi:chorismate mutase